jgi:hypothetical protein
MKRIILIIGIVFLSTILDAQDSIIRKYTYSFSIINNSSSYSLPINNFQLDLPETNFIAVYNKTTMNYNYSSSSLKLNFNLYSPRVACQFDSPIKMDSFNPYATNKPQVSLMLGAVDIFLKKIQD